MLMGAPVLTIDHAALVHVDARGMIAHRLVGLPRTGEMCLVGCGSGRQAHTRRVSRQL